MYDTATITYAPTPPSFPVAGTVTYTFTGTELASLAPPTGWTEPSSGGTTWTDTVNVAANGSVPNSAAVGACRPGRITSSVAQYSGDLNYTGSTSPTNSELLTISKGSTSIATTLAGIGTGGLATSTVYDTATITYAPTPPSFPVAGTVTYTFTGTELASLTPPTGWTEPSSGGTTWTDTVNVAANGSVPNSAAVGLAGRDGLRLQRRYSGDLNYTGSTSPTNSELLTISKGSTSIATTLAGIGTGGLATSTVYDTATITYAPRPPVSPWPAR